MAKKPEPILRLVRFASTTGNGESEQSWRKVITASLEIGSAKGDVLIHFSGGKLIVEQRAPNVIPVDPWAIPITPYGARHSQRVEFDV